MKKRYLLPVALAAGVVAYSCSSDSQKTTTADADKAGGNSAAQALAPGVTPVNLPDPGIPGFHFPDSTHIQNWVDTNQADSINLHGWGLWTALTNLTSQTYNGQRLRVFETWQTKLELDSLMRLPAEGQAAPAALLVRRGPAPKRFLTIPAQFHRDPHTLALATSKAAPHDSSARPVLEVVSYSPSAARNILTRKLFWASSLRKQLAENQKTGAETIPGFSASAASIKPMYEIVPQNSKKPYKMKVWTGSPHTAPNPNGFPQQAWSSCVYVDVHNGVRPNKAQGSVLSCDSSNATNTYNLTDFIYYSLTAAEATALNQAQTHQADRIAHAGDYAILVGMHITTNEIDNWTWQTMWWTPNPDRAPDPSSPAVVAARPKQLTGAPRHYAMSISYQMIAPATATTNVGRSIYTFNPYLEAPFSSKTFSTPAIVITNNIAINNNFGIRTNCMSCHMQATFGVKSTTHGPRNTSLGYIGNTYVDPTAIKKAGLMRTDFLWSISDMATRTGDSIR